MPQKLSERELLRTLRLDNSLPNHPSVPRSIVLLGDSLVSQANDSASLTANCYIGARQGFGWLQAFMGNPFYCPVSFDPATSLPIGYNMGVGGDYASEMKLRLNDDVLSKRPDWVYVLAGTNDVNRGDSYTTITGNLETIYTRILMSGARLIVETIPPRDIDQWASANENLTHCAVNNWIRDYAFNTPGVVLLDPEAYLADPATGDAITGATVDGLHLSPTSGFWRGMEWEEKLGGLVSGVARGFHNPDDVYDATYNPYGNCVTNGELAGIAGVEGTGATGDTSTSFRLERSAGSNVTVVGAKSTVPWGNNSVVTQKVTITLNGGGTGLETIRFRTSSSTVTTGLVAGGWYVGSFWLKVNASTLGTQPLIGSYLQIGDQATGGKTVASLRRYLINYNWPDINIGWLYCETPPIKLIDTTGVTFHILTDVDGSKTDTLELEFHSPCFRRMITPPPSSITF